MTHWSPLYIWMVAICRERGLQDPDKLPEDQAKKLKEEFYKLQQPPPETKKPESNKGVP